MRKLCAVMLLSIITSIQINAQLNYLFFTGTKTYVPVTNGITPHLKTDYVNWEPSDEGFARVPIGFTFQYDGVNYDSANIDVNGFITFKDSLDIFYNYPYFTNFLADLPPYYKRPIIAAFWDDLYLVDTANLVYKTTGHAPFRVFTVEWKKAHWSYNAPDPVLSIELKLYETTNIIEFHYKDEGGTPYQPYAFASIGITSADANRDFISLQSTDANPQISMLKAMDSLDIKPANNQVYRFTPAIPNIPTTIRSTLSYTNKEASFTLHSKSKLTSYEYAVTHSPIPPSSGIKTFSTDIKVSSLLPATTYYVYARSSWFNLSYSQWACDSFITASAPETLPYTFTATPNPPGLPADVRQQNFSDTNFYYNPQYFSGWNGGVGFFSADDNYLLDYTIDLYNADDWLFTPGLKLKAGKTYELKFGYYSYYEYNDGDPSSLEVKYGMACNVAGMNSGTLFNNANLTNGDDVIDTFIQVTPIVTGVYYFGFHNYTPILQGDPIIDNLNITEKTTASDQIPVALEGIANNSNNILSWRENNAPNFELQRSNDGMSFTNLATMNNKNKVHIKQPDFKKQYSLNNEDFWDNLKGKPKSYYEKAFQPAVANIGEKIVRSQNIASSISNAQLNYVDNNAQGTNYYRLQYTNKNGNVSYSNVVKLAKAAETITAFPNPARDVLNINLSSISISKATLQVTNVAGNILMSKEITSSGKGNVLQVNVSQLAAGTYFIKIIASDGSVKTIKKFIKE